MITLSGFNAARGAPQITYSLFADDSIIFLKASYKNAVNLRVLLDKFYDWTEQRINDSKSTLLTSSNLGRSFTRGMTNALRVQVFTNPGKYLGIPLQWGIISEKTFSEIVEKVGNRMQGCKSRNLSLDGRFTKITSTIDPVTYHVMSMVKLPKGLISKIDKYRRNFLWGGDKDKISIHNVKWSTVCNSKDLGGIGIKDLELSNLAFLPEWPGKCIIIVIAPWLNC